MHYEIGDIGSVEPVEDGYQNWSQYLSEDFPGP
jgi:hypothetical protein